MTEPKLKSPGEDHTDAVGVPHPEDLAQAGAVGDLQTGETGQRIMGVVEQGLTPEQIERAISLLEGRFNAEKNSRLCPALDWERAGRALRATPKALGTVLKAEEAGHEPTIYFSDEAGFDIGTRSDETPRSTRDCVYDKEAEQWWKKNRPEEQFNGNAVTQARKMGWDLMSESQGNHIAANTSSYSEKYEGNWFKTTREVRRCGFARKGYRDGDRVVAYQALADRFYRRDGWRGSLRVNFVD